MFFRKKNMNHRANQIFSVEANVCRSIED